MYTAGSGLFVFFLLCMMGLALASTVFWIWAIVDCVQNEPSEGNDKLVWLLIILFTHLVGALIYFFVRRPQRRQMYGR